MQLRDNTCFAWSVMAVLYPTERKPKRESTYPHYTTVLDLKDIEFPVALNQIKKFESLYDISMYTASRKRKNSRFFRYDS